jgi:hypothetical protein
MWKAWIPILLFLVPLILEDQMLGTIFTPYVYGLIVLLAGIIYYFRLKLWQWPLLMFMMAFAIWTYFLMARPAQTQEMIRMLGLDTGPDFIPWLAAYLTTPVWFAILAVNFIIFLSLGPVLLKSLDLEKAAIGIFRLAAREVSGEQKGFTERPFLAGEHGYTRNQLFGLATFMDKHKLCFLEYREKSIRFIFSMGKSPLNRIIREKLSYVDFGDDGRLQVFISRHDYSQYRRDHSFDQLCDKMGKTFLRFAEYIENRMEKRILNEIKTA